MSVTDVAKTTVDNVFISTIICDSGPSYRFAETMIFLNEGEMPEGIEDQDFERCEIAGAHAQHDKWVARVNAAVNSEVAES